MDTQNLWICSGIGCATDATPPTDEGTSITRNSFIFDNGFKFKQDAASTTMYDAQNNPILQFDGRAIMPISRRLLKNSRCL